MSTRHASALAAMSGRWQRSSANAIRVTRAQLRFEYVGVMHAGRGSSQCRGLWIAPGCARERRHLDAAAVRRCSTSAKGFVSRRVVVHRKERQLRQAQQASRVPSSRTTLFGRSSLSPSWTATIGPARAEKAGRLRSKVVPTSGWLGSTAPRHLHRRRRDL